MCVVAISATFIVSSDDDEDEDEMHRNQARSLSLGPLATSTNVDGTLGGTGGGGDSGTGESRRRPTRQGFVPAYKRQPVRNFIPRQLLPLDLGTRMCSAVGMSDDSFRCALVSSICTALEVASWSTFDVERSAVGF